MQFIKKGSLKQKLLKTIVIFSILFILMYLKLIALLVVYKLNFPSFSSYYLHEDILKLMNIFTQLNILIILNLMYQY